MLPLTMNLKACRDAILSLLAQRDVGKSICPSEAARLVFDGDGDGWRALMPVVREAAAELAAEDLIDATQRGRVVDISGARGPVRLRYRSE